MAVTFQDLKQRLIEQADPDVLVELLEISSEELANAFEDKIEDRLEKLIGDYFSQKEIEEADSDDYYRSE